MQTSLHWHDPEANLKQLSHKLSDINEPTDLVILPEMFTSGFTVHPEVTDENSLTTDWLLEMSQKIGAAITGSVACRYESATVSENASPFVNRLLFATPSGDLYHYDKVHLFRMADEHKRYYAGTERKVIAYKGWRLLLTVCYDLRFPVFCRNKGDYDAMLCVANWPQARRHHWRTLLQARAIENQAYVVGVNRVGLDGKGIEYSGDSMVIDFRGESLVDQPGEWEQTVSLDSDALNQYREAFPAWQDADDFLLRGPAP